MDLTDKEYYMYLVKLNKYNEREFDENFEKWLKSENTKVGLNMILPKKSLSSGANEYEAFFNDD